MAETYYRLFVDEERVFDGDIDECWEYAARKNLLQGYRHLADNAVIRIIYADDDPLTRRQPYIDQRRAQGDSPFRDANGDFDMKKYVEWKQSPEGIQADRDIIAAWKRAFVEPEKHGFTRNVAILERADDVRND